MDVCAKRTTTDCGKRAALLFGVALLLPILACSRIKSRSGSSNTRNAYAIALKGPAEWIAGECVELAAEFVDQKNDEPLLAPEPVAVALAGVQDARFFADSQCSGNGLTGVEIAEGQSRALFFARTEKATAGAILIPSTPRFPIKTLPVAIRPAPASKVTAALKVVSETVGACVPLEVSLSDRFGNAAPPSAIETLDLSSAPAASAGKFHADSTCSGNEILSQVQLTSEQPKRIIFFKALIAAEYKLEIKSALVESFSASLKLKPAAPAALSLSGPASIKAGQCVLYEAILKDMHGNRSPASQAVTIELSGGGADSGLYSDGSCSNRINSLILSREAESRTFYFRSTLLSPAPVTLTAKSTGLTDGALSLTITTADAAKLVSTGPASIRAGDCVGGFYAKAQDAFSNDTVVKSPVTIALFPPAAISVFSDNVCTTPLLTLPLAAGTTQTNQFYVKGTSVESARLIAEDALHKLTAAVLTVNIVSGPPAKLTLKGQGRLTAGSCGQFEIETRDAAGYPAKVSGDTVVALGGGGNGKYYSDNECKTLITEAKIAAGTSSRSVYFRSDKAADLLLTAESFPLSAASHALAVVAGPPEKLLITGPSVIFAGACSTVFRVQLADAFGNPAVTSTALSASPSANFAFFQDSLCLTTIKSIPIAAGSSFSEFHIRGTVASDTQVTLSATLPSGTATANHAITVKPLNPVKLLISGTTTFSVGTCERYLIQSSDTYNNLSPVTTNTDVALSTTSGLSFSADSACTSAISTVTIAAGSFTAQVYLGSAKAQSLRASASAPGLSAGLLTIWLNPLPPSKLGLSGPTSMGSGTCAAYSLSSRDRYDNLSPVTSQTVVPLSNTGQGRFYSDNQCKTQITQATLTADASTGFVYFLDSTPELENLKASATGLEEVVLSVRINPSGTWTWSAGDQNPIPPQVYGHYGTKEVPAIENTPPQRAGGATWTDRDGNLWVFGGHKHKALITVNNASTIPAPGTAAYYLNDLWKFDGRNWTWMGGSSQTNQGGVYGTRGQSSALNIPGARSYATTWTDSRGNFYLFGGMGYSATKGSLGYLNDLWKFDGKEWTWLAGTNLVSPQGVYGELGVPNPNNHPGGRQSSVAWVDGNDHLWLFGGNGSQGVFGDLWRFDGTNWTWMSGPSVANQAGFYGILNQGTTQTRPGARQGATGWVGNDGALYLFAGYGYGVNYYGYLNDLWKFDGKVWTWVGGNSLPNQVGAYGTQGVTATENWPGGRYNLKSWKDARNQVWIFSGYGYASVGTGHLNDVWKFDGIQWTWVRGSDIANGSSLYGAPGEAGTAFTPSGRHLVCAAADHNGTFWIFGGVKSSTYTEDHADLWKFSGDRWTWVGGGHSITRLGNYGTKGVGAPSNAPGPRYGAAYARDKSGNIYVFGGAVMGSSFSYYADLWKFDGVNWIWVSGSDELNKPGVTGTRGVPGSVNRPSARGFANLFVDANGHVYVFGGHGLTHNQNTFTPLNDLWKFDGAQWTWLTGTPTSSAAANYGTLGIPSSLTTPSSRFGAAHWMDGQGNFWIFGGLGYAWNYYGYLNDLFRFDGTNWTYMGGSQAVNQAGIYGTKGDINNSDGNFPGGRIMAKAWVDRQGIAWMFGGVGFASSTGQGFLGDLWRFDGKIWTWMGGSNFVGSYGSYGVRGEQNPANIPGSRIGHTVTVDGNGVAWLFGGWGPSANGVLGNLNDLWRFDGKEWVWVQGSSSENQWGTYGPLGQPGAAYSPGGRSHPVSIYDASGRLRIFGGIGFGADKEGVLDDSWLFKAQ